MTALPIRPSSSLIEGVGPQDHLKNTPSPLKLGRPAASSKTRLPYLFVTIGSSLHSNNTTNAARANPPNPARAKPAAPPANGFGLVVEMGRPELAATPPVPAAIVPLKYPVIVDVELSVVVVVPVGATAGSPLTGLTAMRGLPDDDDDEAAAVAGIALKRTVGTTAVERAVDDEALSMTVLTRVFWTVV